MFSPLLLLLFLGMVPLCWGFAPSHVVMQQLQRSHSTVNTDLHTIMIVVKSSLLLFSSFDDKDDNFNDLNMDKNNNDSDSFDFMASLRSRIEQVNDRETKMPLVVLDAMLPRQVLKITVDNAHFINLVKERLKNETPFFGMVGMARLSTGQSVHLKSGVQVNIVGKPTIIQGEGLKLELKAGQRFRITGEVQNAGNNKRWTEARVQFLFNHDDNHDTLMPLEERESLQRAKNKASTVLAPFVSEWINLARGHERQDGQMDQILESLGEMPCSETSPTDFAFWVGALINPIPAMGVALEIRPALLSASTAEKRIDVVHTSIERSIWHMQGKEPFQISNSEFE